MRRYIWPAWNFLVALCATYVIFLFLPKLLPQLRLAFRNHESEVWGTVLGVGYLATCLCVMICTLSIFNGKLRTARRLILFAIVAIAVGCLITSIVLMAPDVRQFFWRDAAFAATIALFAAAPGMLLGVGLANVVWFLPSRLIQRCASQHQ